MQTGILSINFGSMRSFKVGAAAIQQRIINNSEQAF